jgi:hypothetical protein
MECGQILESAAAEEEGGNYEEAAKLYYKASLCFGMVNDLPSYEGAKRKAGELYLTVTYRSERPIQAVRPGLLAYKILNELGDPRVKDFVGVLMSLIANGGQELLADRETCILAARFLRERGKMAEAAQIYASLAEALRRGGNHQLAARLYSDAAACENAVDRRKASRYNKMAGELFMSCGLHLEASQHFVRSFLELMTAGEVDGSLLDLSDEACRMGEIAENWHTELVSVCKSLSQGDVRSALAEWKDIRYKFKPSFNSLVERAIDECKRRRAT